jgi:hypothetical protein
MVSALFIKALGLLFKNVKCGHAFTFPKRSTTVDKESRKKKEEYANRK